MSMTPPLCAAPDPAPRAPQFALPDGACDCHFHIFDGPSLQVAERSYTAPPAPLDALRHLHRTLGISRSVIVQPSVYGNDNRTTLETCAADPAMKAIVVIDQDTPADTLPRTGRAVPLDAGSTCCSPAMPASTALPPWPRASPSGLAPAAALRRIATGDRMDQFAALPVPVVFDHFGHSGDQGSTTPVSRHCCAFWCGQGLGETVRRLPARSGGLNGQGGCRARRGPAGGQPGPAGLGQ